MRSQQTSRPADTDYRGAIDGGLVIVVFVRSQPTAPVSRLRALYLWLATCHRKQFLRALSYERQVPTKDGSTAEAAGMSRTWNRPRRPRREEFA